MNKISFAIISRGTMIVSYGDKKIKISGELTFTPPIFYADIKSIHRWEKPFENILVSKEEKNEILNFIISESNKDGMTKVLFD